MDAMWEPTAPGVVRLPSGRLVRGRGLRAGPPAGPAPTIGVYLLGAPPPPVDWESRWLPWPDFRLPRRAVETFWQKRYVARFRPAGSDG